MWYGTQDHPPYLPESLLLELWCLFCVISQQGIFICESFIQRKVIFYTIYLQGGHYTAAGCGIVGVGPRKTHFYPQKYNFGRNRHDGIFQKSQRQHTAPPIKLSSIKNYTVGTSDSSLFGVAHGNGKGDVGPRTTNLTSQKIIIGSMVSISPHKEQIIFINE